MIIVRKLFSRHTPKGLKKYKDYKDEDLDKMTKGQKLRALEEEDETAVKNSNKYVYKKLKKYIPVGAAVGGTAMGIMASKGQRIPGAVAGAITGGVLGAAGGAMRGQYFANKEGHDRDKRTIRLARKMDENARKNKIDDDFEDRVNSKIRTRKTAEDARAARDYAAASYYRSW